MRPKENNPSHISGQEPSLNNMHSRSGTTDTSVDLSTIPSLSKAALLQKLINALATQDLPPATTEKIAQNLLKDAQETAIYALLHQIDSRFSQLSGYVHPEVVVFFPILKLLCEKDLSEDTYQLILKILGNWQRIELAYREPETIALAYQVGTAIREIMVKCGPESLVHAIGYLKLAAEAEFLHHPSIIPLEQYKPHGRDVVPGEYVIYLIGFASGKADSRGWPKPLWSEEDRVWVKLAAIKALGEIVEQLALLETTGLKSPFDVYLPNIIATIGYSSCPNSAAYPIPKESPIKAAGYQALQRFVDAPKQDIAYITDAVEMAQEWIQILWDTEWGGRRKEMFEQVMDEVCREYGLL